MSRALLLLLAVAASAACPRPEPPPPPSPGPQCGIDVETCTQSSDCTTLTASRPFCNLNDAVDGVGCCHPGDLCFGDADCVEGAVCNFRRGLCEFDAPCLTSTECPDDDAVCQTDDGFAVCRPPPVPASCVVTADGAVTSAGAALRLEALALDDFGGLSPAAPAPAWTASSGVVDGDAFTSACGGDSDCRVTVTASFAGGATCTGELRVYPTSPPGVTRVVVVDAVTRAPLRDVRIDARVDGAFITTATGDNGSATVAGDIELVSAFPPEHAWHTAIAPPPFVVFVVEPALDVVSGVKGSHDFTELRTQGDLKVAVTGLALPSLVDVSRDALFGDVAPLHVELEGVTPTGGRELAWPSTVVMNLGENPIQAEFVALGASPLVWALGGELRLPELTDAFATGGPEAFGVFAREVLPHMATFQADLVPLQTLVAHARPPRGEDGTVSFHAWPFEELVLTPNTRLRNERNVTFGEHTERDVVIAALARIPGRGFVPLGLDVTARQPSLLAFATPFDGMEGSDVVIAAVALDLDTLLSAPSVRAVFAADREGAVELPPFLAHVDASFDGVALTATHDDPSGAGGADIYRVRFTGDGGAWTITSASAPSFVVDELHAGDVDTSARTTSARLDAVRGTLDEPTAIASRPVD